MATKLTRRDPPRLGRFDLVEKVGEGGVGTVYRGRDRDTGDAVAIKVLTADLAENPGLLDRFAQEFRSTTRLDHPNIVRALDCGTDGTRAYLVMEFVEGQSLGHMIEAAGRLPEGQAVRLITQVAQALHYAHRQGIVHRDVKPDNVLVRTDGVAKLTDFGLAKDFEDGAQLTRTSTGLGTPHYMAPEQYTNAKAAGVPCDIYSLGATLYATVTGTVPFAKCGSITALAKKIKGEVPAPRDLVRDLSEQVDGAIRKAMDPDPTKRPVSCLKFARMLPSRRQWEGMPNSASGTIPTPPPRGESDRRTSARRRYIMGTTCTVDAALFPGGSWPEDAWPATIRNLSAGGIGLALARRYEPGTVFTVEIEGDRRRPALTLKARVAHVHPEPEGHWFHGCTFFEPLPERVVQYILG